MYKKSAKKFFNWSCQVGGGSPEINGKVHGMGCVIDDHHILTAYHCWSSISDKYAWPVALRKDGIFRCKIIYKSIDDDIAILKIIKRIDDRKIKTFTEYPDLSFENLFLGSSVGFVSRLKLYDSLGKKSSHSHFSNGTVSMLVPNEGDTGIKYTVSSTVIQKGFSGSAVFLPSGEIVAVVVETLRFAADITDLNSPIFVLPVIAPIGPLIEEINSAIAINSVNS